MGTAWSGSAKTLTQTHWRLLSMLGAASFFEGYDINIVIVALPQIRETFGLTQAQASLWISVLYLGALPAMVLSRRADRRGRRSLLIVTIWGYTATTVATAVAPTIAVFALLQFCARVFLIAEVAIAWTMIAEELPATARGFGFGTLAMLSALGTGLAALLYGLVLAPLGLSWRWLYVAAVPVLMLVIVLRRRLPESRRFSHAKREGRLAIKGAEILSPPHLSRLLLAAGALFLAELTTQALIFVVDFMQTQHGLSPSAANLMLIGAGGLAIPVLVYAGSLSDRYGRKRTAVSFLIVSVIGPIVFFGLAEGVLPLFAALTLTYVGSFGAWPTLGAYGSELFPTRLRALGGSVVGGAKVAGQFFSFLLAGLLINATGSLATAVIILSGGPVLAALLTLALPETKGKELEEISDEEVSVAAAELAVGKPL
jgi:MFS family permease